MALGSLDVPLEDITEIISAAQRSIKGKLRRGSSYELRRELSYGITEDGVNLLQATNTQT